MRVGQTKNNPIICCPHNRYYSAILWDEVDSRYTARTDRGGRNRRARQKAGRKRGESGGAEEGGRKGESTTYTHCIDKSVSQSALCRRRLFCVRRETIQAANSSRRRRRSTCREHAASGPISELGKRAWLVVKKAEKRAIGDDGDGPLPYTKANALRAAAAARRRRRFGSIHNRAQLRVTNETQHSVRLGDRIGQEDRRSGREREWS